MLSRDDKKKLCVARKIGMHAALVVIAVSAVYWLVSSGVLDTAFVPLLSVVTIAMSMGFLTVAAFFFTVPALVVLSAVQLEKHKALILFGIGALTILVFITNLSGVLPFGESAVSRLGPPRPEMDFLGKFLICSVATGAIAMVVAIPPALIGSAVFIARQLIVVAKRYYQQVAASCS